MGYSNATYLSERMCGDRNFALAYFMKERKVFPKKINILDILEFYFQCCSLTSSTDKLSIVAGQPLFVVAKMKHSSFELLPRNLNRIIMRMLEKLDLSQRLTEYHDRWHEQLISRKSTPSEC